VPFAETPDKPTVVDALVQLGLAASKSAARRLIEQGGVTVNGQRIPAGSDSLGEPLSGEYYLLKKGGRDFGLLQVRS